MWGKEQFMNMAEPDAKLMQAMLRIDALLQRVEQLPDPAVRANVTDILQSLLDLHGQALARMLELFGRRGDQAQPIFDALEADQLISGVLLVHGLHPRSIEQRVQRALQQIQPYLAAHNGGVELLEVTGEQVVRLRLAGDCRACPGSRATLDNLIKEAIFLAAPDVAAIEVEGAAPDPDAAAASAPSKGQAGRECPRVASPFSHSSFNAEQRS